MILKPEDPGFIEGFDWGLYPQVEKFVVGQIDGFLSRHGFAKELSGRMAEQSSTRFMDWIDHMVLPASSVSDNALEKLEYQEVLTEDVPEGCRLFKQNKTEFFPILVSKGTLTELALKPESLDHFLQMLGSGAQVEGEMFVPLRKAALKKDGDFLLSAIERRGGGGYLVKEEDANDVPDYLHALSAFFARRRFFENDNEGLKETEELVEGMLNRLGKARVSDAFFRSERTYWQRRNRAGQIQKARQDRLGLGWGNHDHHTYRSSRDNFANLIRILEKMGYLCREKFYAGAEARWGAQILEHPLCDIVVFADVDLFPEETEIDFPHRGLENRADLGTVGLWIALHGESVLQAGMHHLEARFDFERLRNDLPNFGIGVMKPFSNFAFLKQAFTTGETWQVDRGRLDGLLKEGSITQAQYEGFVEKGAIGSHLENLQRDQGFKGFNQKSVTAIIRETDPRTYKVEHA